jgi:outer membrane lipoprotein SlyB
MKSFTIAVGLIMTVMLSGCVSNLSGTTYSRSEARQVQNVEYGVVESAIPVVLEGTNSVIGTGAGAVIGGIAASNIGGGRGKDIATVLGAVAGGVAGKNAEEALTRTQGQEITVRWSKDHEMNI